MDIVSLGVCDLCKGSKHIWKDGKLTPCLCLIRDRLIRYLGGFAYASNIEKTFLLDNKDRTLFLKGHPKRISAHIKHFLICQGMGFNYKYVPAQEILDVFLGNNESQTSLFTYMNYELVLIDLNSVYKNIALGELLNQVLYLRTSVSKPTWFLSERDLIDLAPILNSDSFSSKLKSMKCIVQITEKNTKWRENK